MRVVVDHLAGARRGQRQELAAGDRIRFGRHPECEVAFDTHKDLDASSRHAELRPAGEHWQLADIGSSNGTFVDGKRATDTEVVRARAIAVEFGTGGPRVRLFIGDTAQIAALAPAIVEPRRFGWLFAVAAVAVVAALAIAMWRC